MPLDPGTTLGPYKIQAPLGVGGMGEVYQARDTKLDRDVALKVLPEAFTSDPDRLTRFEREAKVLASLNHTNIGSIYGLEEAAGVRALVLELIEGPTLADRIAQGPIPVDEALPIAKQIAEALEAAHEAGVIHRDLKPANIKLREDGTVKVLDFGLAKALDTAPQGDPDQSPTAAAAVTRTGVIMGTAAYMSPEQARGKPVDKRTDIWAFGCVLYEMLVGRRAFVGEDASDTLVAVLRGDVDFEALPADTRARLRWVIEACLKRDLKQRVHDIADVRLAMEGAFGTTVGSKLKPRVAPPLRSWQRPIPIALTALGCAFVGGFAVWTLTGSPSVEPSGVARVELNTPADGPFVLRSSPIIAVSPHGSHVVYRSGTDSLDVEGTGLFVRDLEQEEATLLLGTEGASNPFFSPDGEWVAFQDARDLSLKRVRVAGGAGAPLSIAPLSFAIRGATWGDDDTIIIGQRDGGLMSLPLAGGEPEAMTALDSGRGETSHRYPHALPGGRHVLFTLGFVGYQSVAALSIETGSVHDLVAAGSSPQYVETGHIVYGIPNRKNAWYRDESGTLRAVRFNPDVLETVGEAVTVADNVARGTNGVTHFAASRTGSLVLASGGKAAPTEKSLVWVDAQGGATPIVDAKAEYANPRLSPDGTQIAVTIGNDGVWICDVGRACRLLRRDGSDPVWTPDGARVVFVHAGDLYWIPADGSGEAELLLEDGLRPTSWSPDGEMLAFSPNSPGGGDIELFSLDGTRQPYISTRFSERSPMFSPNGRWIAYRSDWSGRSQIYVRPYPNGPETLVSIDGGREPVWSRDGRRLYFRDGNRLMEAEVSDGPTFEASTPHFLFEGYDPGLRGLPNYDAAHDGGFVMVSRESANGASPPQLRLWLNWSRELERLVSAN